MSQAPAAVTTQTTLLEDTYLGHDITVKSVRRQRAAYTSSGTFADGRQYSHDISAEDYTRVVGMISGYSNGVRLNGAKSDDPQAVLKACHKVIDQDIFDRSVRSTVTSLIYATKVKAEIPTLDRTPQVNDIAYVYAMGYWRRGLVTKVSRNGKATVSYTTSSSDGRIFHKTSNDVVVAA